MNAPQRPEFPELLDQLRSIVEAKLLEYRLDAASAAELAGLIAEQVRADWGGQHVYIPKVMSRADVAKRNEEIVAAFNGLNALELCRKHGISASHLRRIVGEAAARATAGAPKPA